MAETITVTVLVVSYNVREHLHRCLDSVTSSLALRPSLGAETVVIDNASSDGSATFVSESFPEVKLVANSANVGFTRAVNQGLALASGEAVLVLNPDTVVEGDAIGVLVDTLFANSAVAVVGPQMRNADGGLQPSRRRFSPLLLAFVESTPVQRLLPDLPMLRRYYCQDTPDVEQDVDWLTGACLLVRRSAVEAVGGMDERFFMYFEEVDWCRRFQRAGWRVRYQPAAHILHVGSASGDQDLTRRHILFNSSKWRFYAKWHGAFWGTVLRWYLWATFGYQALEESAKWLLWHKPALRRQRVQSYLRVLRSGLA